MALAAFDSRIRLLLRYSRGKSDLANFRSLEAFPRGGCKALRFGGRILSIYELGRPLFLQRRGRRTPGPLFFRQRRRFFRFPTPLSGPFGANRKCATPCGRNLYTEMLGFPRGVPLFRRGRENFMAPQGVRSERTLVLPERTPWGNSAFEAL